MNIEETIFFYYGDFLIICLPYQMWSLSTYTKTSEYKKKL